jgi:hypothetical protein
MNSKITISEELSRFIKEYATDRYTLQLILFFAAHPYARFSELTIIHALNQNGGRCSLQKALRNLVDRGLIIARFENKVVLYSLPDNTLMRSILLELAQLDVYQQWLLIRQSYPYSATKESAYADGKIRRPINLAANVS